MTTHGMTYHTTSVTGGYSVKQWKAANREERELAQEVLSLKKKNVEAKCVQSSHKKQKQKKPNTTQTFVFEV